MPDEYDVVADRLWKRMEKEFGECNSKECRQAREEAQKVWLDSVANRDGDSVKEIKALRDDLGKIFETLEKAREEADNHAPEECPNCHYNDDKKPANAGKCPNGCSKFSTYDKKKGFNHCPVCGEEVDWGGNDEEEEE